MKIWAFGPKQPPEINISEDTGQKQHFLTVLGVKCPYFHEKPPYFQHHLVCNKQIHLWEKFWFELASEVVIMKQKMITLLYCTIIYSL